MNKFLPALLFLLFLSFTGFTQINIPDPDSILIGTRKLPSVFLVGTFHFAYYNLDAHKTDADAQIDILSEQKQKEVKELVNYISLFKPTKIAVEAGLNTSKLLDRYSAYKRKEKTAGRDEMEQLGFRLMEKLNLDTIYGVNDSPLLFDFYNSKDSTAFATYLDSIYTDWDFQSDDTISKLYDVFYHWDDKVSVKVPLLDYFKYLNSDKVLNRGYGAYLNGDFTLGDTRGADALAMHWYSRNLRIYRHIQQITTSADDRILVIFGAGHVQILKHLFECSPQYKLVKFGELK